MNVDEVKLRRQLIAIDKWRKSGGVGRFIHPTGFGKTYEMLLVINKFHTKNPNKIVLVVCNNVASKQNFMASYNELHNMLDDIIRKNLFIHSRQEILNAKDNFRIKPTLVIIDEIHEFISTESYNIINKRIFDYRFILGVTATDVSAADKNKLDRIMPIVDMITPEEAEKNKWITPIKEYNLGINLLASDRELYDKYSKFITECMTLVDGQFDILQGMASGRKDRVTYEYVTYDVYCDRFAHKKGWRRDLDLSNRYYRNLDNLLSPASLHERAKKFMKYVRNRNILMETNIVKLRVTKQISDLIGDKKAIIFNNNIDFVDMIHYMINNNVSGNKYNSSDWIKSYLKTSPPVMYSKAVKYHSKLISTPMYQKDNKSFIKYKNGNIKQFGVMAQRKEYIRRLKSGDATIMCAAKGLDTAMNIEDLEVCVITAGTTNPLQQIQRKGRSTRISEYKKLAIIINVYFKDTRDEIKLRQRQGSIPIIEINTVNQILFN